MTLFRQRFLRSNTEARFTKEHTDKLNFIKIKYSALQKAARGMKREVRPGEMFATHPLKKGLYSEHVTNFQNAIMRKQSSNKMDKNLKTLHQR